MRTRDQLQSAIGWMFRDRKTGRIVVAQWPNIPLVIWIVTAIFTRVVDLHGRVNTIIGAIGIIALIVWAVDEILRGVNPWRRLLGAVVLGVLVVGWARR